MVVGVDQSKECQKEEVGETAEQDLVEVTEGGEVVVGLLLELELELSMLEVELVVLMLEVELVVLMLESV